MSTPRVHTHMLIDLCSDPQCSAHATYACELVKGAPAVHYCAAHTWRLLRRCTAQGMSPTITKLHPLVSVTRE